MANDHDHLRTSASSGTTIFLGSRGFCLAERQRAGALDRVRADLIVVRSSTSQSRGVSRGVSLSTIGKGIAVLLTVQQGYEVSGLTLSLIRGS